MKNWVSAILSAPIHSAFPLLPFFDGADGETRTLAGHEARQFTKLLLSLLSHVGSKERLKVEGCQVAGGPTSRVGRPATCNLTTCNQDNGGLPRCCPVLCGLRDRCIAAMLAARNGQSGR